MHKHSKDNDKLIWIAELSISTLFLYRDQRYRGYCILSFSAWDATSLESLRIDEHQQFMMDLRTASIAIRSSFKPDHMNYELLGNTNPHLHWHIIPRYKKDPHWGRPIWEGWSHNEPKPDPLILEDQEYLRMIDLIRKELAKQ